jgi:hypothetical protein
MNEKTKRLLALLGWGCTLAPVPLLLAGQAAAWAEAGGSATGTGTHDQSGAPVAVAEELVTAPFTVEDIDRNHRTLAVRSPDGERTTMSVPADMQGFEKLKKGDKIDVDYYRSVAVSVLPAGSAAAANQPREQSQRMMNGHANGGGNSGGGTAMKGRQITSSAEVVSVNRRDNSMQVKGPGGKTQTVNVQDPSLQKKMQGLKPGDVVQVTYTEAVVAAVRPSQSRK